LFEKYLNVLTTCRNFQGATLAIREAVALRRFSAAQIATARKLVGTRMVNDMAMDGQCRSRRKRKIPKQSPGQISEIA